MLPVSAQFGPIDIYLFDQLLRGNIAPGMSILDAGCGYGRNLVYFLREGYTVRGADVDPEAIESVRALANSQPPAHFQCAPIENMPFADACADVVIANAVLHFAGGEPQFRAMLHGCWRVLKPSGLLFCRLASSIGIEAEIQPLGNGRFLLPDGSERFLVNASMLYSLTGELGAALVDPIKSTVVDNQRSMATWVIRKPI